MKEHYLFADLIDIEELRPMLKRLYEALQLTFAILTPEGNVIAEQDNRSSTSRRNYNRYSCLKTSLTAIPPGCRCLSTRCSHTHLNLICPIILDEQALAHLVLFHLPDSRTGLEATGPPQKGDIRELEIYFSEFAGMLAEMAHNRRECLRSQRALEEKSHLFKVVTDNIVDTVWLMDLDFKITFASPSLIAKRGYTLEELREMTLDKHLTPDSYRKACELMVENLQAAERDSQVYKLDMEYCRKDGNTFWAETHLRFIRSLNGEISGILGVGRDISERITAEQQIKKLRQQLSAFEAPKTGTAPYLAENDIPESGSTSKSGAQPDKQSIPVIHPFSPPDPPFR